jgi:hypothetical protein
MIRTQRRQLPDRRHEDDGSLSGERAEDEGSTLEENERLEAVIRFEGTKFYPRLCSQQRDRVIVIEARWSLVHRHRALTINHQQLLLFSKCLM